ncbi:MAG: regulator [Flavobacteriaceae bacterium]|nr:regulator [Flavobacteriaceae bacterium]
MIRTLLAIVLTGTTFFTHAQTPCDNGTASGFPCLNFDLQSRFTPQQLNASFANDSWGWTDPQDGKEYALVGLNNGTAFIDISDPVNPIYLGKLPTHATGFGDIWRDVKVYDNHAFVVSEISGHGMQVFDLTRLRNVSNPPQTFSEDAHYDEFGSAHNIVINTDTGYAYAVGTGTFSGGAHFINIQNPTNPIAAGGYALDGYSHDAQVVTYNGPDSDYAGREIYIGSNQTEVVLVDVTEKNSPQPISTISYNNVSYTHQGWFTEDQRYFLLGDETDEIDFGFNTKTIIFDFSDLDNPELHTEFFGPTPATDHNGYVVGDKYYFANYSAGLNVLDISDIANTNISQYGFFDTTPSSNSAGFDGSWNVYPFFESRNIVISGDEGFTLVRDESELNVATLSANDFVAYPNPATTTLTVATNNETLKSVEIYSILGQKVWSAAQLGATTHTYDIAALQAGVYLLRVNNSTTKKLIIK